MSLTIAVHLVEFDLRFDYITSSAFSSEVSKIKTKSIIFICISQPEATKYIHTYIYTNS